MKKLAPITLFVYNRPEHTKLTVEALQRNGLAQESDLFVFSDGCKDIKDQDNVQKVRDYIRAIDGFKSVTLIERSKNQGLANSIIAGVSEIVQKFGKIIVLEDDLITSPYFLQYMNDALNLYENEDKVICIHGYVYPVKMAMPETFFLKGAECWGWATWKRGWDLFEKDGMKLLKGLEKRKLTREFDFNGTVSFTKMLRDQIKGKNNSWAIRWYASAFLKDKLTLYPGRSLVHNIGYDGSGTHCDVNYSFDVALEHATIDVEKIEASENKPDRRAFENFFQSIKRSLFVRLKQKVKGILRHAL